ncbi:MarR family transcriptional regulator [Nocardia concava]|uniref:MarR family transcriptional regulator n=1 Tax=Nocardia concava TaxID=257281 RepID=UPI00030A8BC6|nr:helix-turn-helix domain-containing protein [Nocardia concava]
MALTEAEAKVLGTLFFLGAGQVLTVQQIRLRTGLGDGSVRRALVRLVRTGLVRSTPGSPASWRPTERGLLAVKKSAYSDYIAEVVR